MSRDLIVLTPNGRRTKIHCTPDTSFLQVLEDVCTKQGFQSSDYDLKHHNHVLDLTTTIRFCNIPNRATLEMVEAEKKRVESNITIGLTLDDGDRRTAEFTPNTSLYDVVISLAPNEFKMLQNPTVMYMRQEVVGQTALREKTLRHLGLIAGKAILRLLDKIHTEQANVSSVYRRVQEEKKENLEVLKTKQEPTVEVKNEPGPSGVQKVKGTLDKFDPIKIIKNEKTEEIINPGCSTKEDSPDYDAENATANVTNGNDSGKSSTSEIDPEVLERRLRIEEEVSFLGSQKAIAFMRPEDREEELADLPDDFYDLTIEEVRKIYHDLQQSRIELENTPLLTSTKRSEMQTQVADKILNTYKNCVVRVQFPDSMILQGVFSPNDTVQDILHFIKEHLQNPNQPFQLFSTPLKEPLNPKLSLLEARFVPCVHVHFKWMDDESGPPYLRDDIYLNKTSSDAASILASKYRAPSRRKLEDVCNAGASSSTSKQSKVPKWFKK